MNKRHGICTVKSLCLQNDLCFLGANLPYPGEIIHRSKIKINGVHVGPSTAAESAEAPSLSGRGLF